MGNISYALTDASFTGLTSAISESVTATDVATVFGIAIGASFGIYLVVWGCKRIIKSVRSALNGKFRA